MTDAMRLGAETSAVCDRFIRDLNAMPDPNVLELGTKRADPEVPTHHREWAPLAGAYIMADIEYGLDVDIKIDAHDMTPWMIDGGTDAVIAVAVWEHLELPWVAAQELARILRAGGIAYVSTHMAFPRHGYPSDYTRWTREGLAAMFDWAGMETLETSYMYEADLIPHDDLERWNPAAPTWLVVDAYLRKP